MFGIRIAPLILRTTLKPSLTFIPKQQFALMTKQTTLTLMRAAPVPRSFLLENLNEQAETTGEEGSDQVEGVTKLQSLLSKDILRMTDICLWQR